ncbi:unnamed protein product [Sphenostylis stenocarpa]|uniref:Uncharacterized protein n=1 Tax=Sphenostylis stenocarpa TaxID=92480 RepID=A0AA86TGN3_9FABA|nr:unnamed protein product [Sphenostylis stenocarpa]
MAEEEDENKNLIRSDLKKKKKKKKKEERIEGGCTEGVGRGRQMEKREGVNEKEGGGVFWPLGLLWK